MGMVSSAWSEWLQASGLLESRGVFVTGTDTEVGKTWVSVQFIHLLRALGHDVIPRKPIESGWPEASRVQQTDAWLLAKAAGLPLHEQRLESTLEAVCPYHFRAALSPPRAADMEGRKVRVMQAAATCAVRPDERNFLLVEGAGGFYSPLASDGLNADLAQVLGLPVVLVAEDRLGCINQVLLTAYAIRHKGLKLAGVILNPRTLLPDGMQNAQDLRQFLDVPVMRLAVA